MLALVPVVLAVLTAITYLLGTLADHGRRSELRLDLLANSPKEEYLYAGGLVLFSVVICAFASVFLWPVIAVLLKQIYRPPDLDQPGRIKPPSREVGLLFIALGAIYFEVGVLANFFSHLAFYWTSFLSTALLFSWLAAVVYVYRVPLQIRRGGFLVSCIVLSLLQCAILAGAHGRHFSHVTSFPVILFSPEPNSQDPHEGLVLGSDDKQLAVLMKPDPKKNEKVSYLVYISRSEWKRLTLIRRTSESEFNER